MESSADLANNRSINLSGSRQAYVLAGSNATDQSVFSGIAPHICRFLSFIMGGIFQEGIYPDPDIRLTSSNLNSLEQGIVPSTLKGAQES